MTTSSDAPFSTGRQVLALTGWLALCFATAGTAAFVSADGCYAAMIKST